MKGLIVLANGFEDTEALTTIDILKRSGIEIEKVNMGDNDKIISQYDNEIIVLKKAKDINIDDYDFLVIPGGKAVMNNLLNSNKLDEIVLHMARNKKLICAICAGPLVLGKHNLLSNEKFTCFKGCEKDIKGEYINEGVCVSNNYITAKSMAYTIPFALEIVKKITSEKIQKQVEKSIYSIGE